MKPYNLSNLLSDRHNGVKCRHGILEYHADIVSAKLAHHSVVLAQLAFIIGCFNNVFAVKQNFAADNVSGWLR